MPLFSRSVTILETFAFELQDREIKQIVDSLALTVKSWEMVLADLSNSDLDRGLEIAEVKLIPPVQDESK